MGVTGKLMFSTIVIGAGSGFQHGYNTGIVNSPQAVIMNWITEAYIKRGDVPKQEFITMIWSVAVGIYCLGGIIGGAMSSLFSSNLGRRGALLVNNIFAIIAGILMFMAKYVNSPEMFIIGRFVTGYNCGLNSGICAMYLIEIATTAIRGAIGTVYQLIIVISILVSQVFGMKICLGTETLWPYLFAVTAIVGVLQLVLLPFCPESPKYLMAKKGEEACKKALDWLRGEDTSEELSEIKAEQAKEAEMGKVGCSQMCSISVLRKPLMISIMIMLAQQLSGINAVIYFSTATFTHSGFTEKGAQNGTLCMGFMNIVMTIISMFLVDRAGRKTLLLVGFVGMVIITTCLTLTLHFIHKADFLGLLSVVFVVLYVVMFAVGPGSIPWFLVTEFFSPEARPLAAGIAAATNWSANFVVGLCFLPLQSRLGALVFIIFIVCQIIFILLIAITVPETKNKTYEEISGHFK